MKFVMVQPDDSGIFLVPDFVDETTAQDFATANGIGGSIQEESLFVADVFSLALLLEQAKDLKIVDLTIEGNGRCTALDSHFFSAENAFIFQLVVNVLTTLGNDLAAVGVAWDAARTDILALPDLAAVQAYDVTTDPTWP